jgi:hypothetical protein
MQIWPKTESLPPSHPPLLIHLVKASSADSSLGGGAPTYPATAGALPEGAPTTIEGCPTRTIAAGE